MITVIDAGARYGPHPSFQKLFNKNLSRIYAFEPEPKEYRVLYNRFKDHPNYHIENSALGETEGELYLNIHTHNGQTSSFEADNNSHWFTFHRQMIKEWWRNAG